MALQNRVDPFGELFATPARGTMFGNRGGKFHTDAQGLTARRWVSRQWICCVLDFKGRQRDVWGRYYTELFFLDEVTAFAAGHRPCFECRRKDAERFAALFVASNPARPRESADPVLDSRWSLHSDDAERRSGCGNERRRGRLPRLSAKAIDDVLHAERLDGKAKRIHRRNINTLPDGAMLVRDGEAYAVRGNRLLRWTPRGYRDAKPRPKGVTVDVLTPPAMLKVLSRGYLPRWHRSAG